MINVDNDNRAEIYNSFGFVTVPLRGKRPLSEKWQTENGCRPIDQMPGYGTTWSSKDITGYGVLLGTQCGPDHLLVAVDIDLDNYDQIRDIRSSLPYSPMMKKGKKGVTMFYRTAPELAKTRVYKGMVDYLGIGRQTVMPGSIHPETKKPYEWYEGTSWVRCDALPILTEDHIEQMEEMLAILGWDRKYHNNAERHQIRVVVSDCELVPGSSQWVNRHALDNIPAWVEELGLYKGEWRGARYDAVNTLRPSSTGRPDAKRKRNLKIHPFGIIDFGSKDTYSPIDLVMAVKKLKNDEALDWLARRVDPHYGQKQEVSETITSKPPKAPALRMSDDEGKPLEITKVNRKMGPLPAAAFDQAPGFIGRYARELLRHSPRTPKTLATLAGISAISAITARRYIGETRGRNLQLTTYVCAMASTGAGKDAAFKFQSSFVKACADRDDTRCHYYDYGAADERLTRKAGGVTIAPAKDMSVNAFDRLIVGSDVTGDAGFISMFWHSSPCPWLVIDEFGSVFASLTSNKQKSSVPVTALLRSWYSLTPVAVGKSYAYNQTVSKELLKLRLTPMLYPAPSVFGVTTPEQMYSALDKSMAEDGTINRFIIAHEDASIDTFDEIYNDLFGARSHNQISSELIDEALDIFTFAIHQGNGSGDYGFLGYVNDMDDRFDIFAKPTLLVVEAESDEVRRAMGEYIKSVKDEMSQPEIEVYASNSMARVGENFLRLCYLAAIADNEDRDKGVMPEVRMSHVEWAKLVMDTVKVNLSSLVTDHLASKEDKEQQKLIEKIEKKANELIDLWKAKKPLPDRVKIFNGWISLDGLTQRFNGAEKSKAAALLKGTMKDQGLVELANIDPSTGRPAQKGKACVRFMDMFE